MAMVIAPLYGHVNRMLHRSVPGKTSTNQRPDALLGCSSRVLCYLVPVPSTSTNKASPRLMAHHSRVWGCSYTAAAAMSCESAGPADSC